MFERFSVFRQKPIEIKLDEVPQFLSGRFEREGMELDARLSGNFQYVKACAEELKNVANQMIQKSSPKRYANIVKDKFCEKLLQKISDLLSYGASDRKEFLMLSDSVVQSVNDINIKEFRHLAEFKGDMQKVAEKIRVMEEKIKASRKILDASPVRGVEEIKGDVSKIFSLQNSVTSISNEIEDLKKSVEPLETRILTEQKNVELKNEDLSRYAGKRIEIRNLEKTSDDIRQKITNEFAGLDRCMKKFVYYGELTKEETNILKQYISDPGTAFLGGDERMVIRQIFDAMESYHDRVMIELDERKLEKLHDVIRHFDLLRELKEHHRQVRQKVHESEDQFNEFIEPIVQSLKVSHTEIADLEKELGGIKNRITAKTVERQMIERQIADMRNKMQVGISLLLNSQVKLA